MRVVVKLFTGIVLSSVMGCAAAAHAPPASPAAPMFTLPPLEAAEATAPALLVATAMPKEAPATFDGLAEQCTQGNGAATCSMSFKSAETVCKSMSPTDALRAFAGHGRLSVAYLTHDLDAWSTARVRSTKSRASFDEEVLVLAERRAQGSIIVSGSAVSYEVLRYDGSCATLMGDELTFKAPPLAARPVPWDKLDGATRETLATDRNVKSALAKRAAACASPGSKRCVVTSRLLGGAVLTAARANR